MKLCLRAYRPFQLGCRCHINRCDGINSIAASGRRTGRPFRIPEIPSSRTFATIGENRKTTSRPSRSFRQVSVENPQKRPEPSVQDDQSPAAWIQQLEPYIPLDLRDGITSDNLTTNSTENNEHFSSDGEKISAILSRARRLHRLDLLAYLGFTLQRWPAVYALITTMLDAADKLQMIGHSFEGTPSNLQWELLDDDQIVTGISNNSAAYVSMEALTDEPRYLLARMAIMGQIWQSLGFIVLTAANKTSQESELAMSYVYRTLAHLHQSGNISDAIYKFTNRTDNGDTFRPPGMHLLSTHIMNVLSDAAWLDHEAEATRKAKAAGEDSPFRPFKMGIRHLGSQIWLEFILWACIEQGHIMEGLWILKHLRGSNYAAAWKVASWSPLLGNPELIKNTKIDIHDFWPHPDIPRTPDELQNKSGFFHGLGRFTISAEVFNALTTQAASYVQINHESDNNAKDLIELLASVMEIKQSYSDKEIGNQNASGYHIIPVLESQILNPKLHPEQLDHLLHALPPPIPPWNDAVPTDRQGLSAFAEQNLYETSSLYTGLLQQNLRLYAHHQQIENAMRIFDTLLEIIDSSKLDRIQDFWSKGQDNEGVSEISYKDESLPQTSIAIDQSPIPTLPNGALGDLLDLVRISKAYAFGKWLLFSKDADGPIITFSSYGDQSLAPSILRFAAAIDNQELGDLVIQQIREPISRNTYNAVANFYIAFGQWEEAEGIFKLLIEYRKKAWGETTLATLASTILRLEQRVWEEPWDEQLQTSLLQAQTMLRKFLWGRYNPTKVYNESVNLYYKQTIYRWHCLLSSVPGAVARVANDVKPVYTNPLGRDKFSFIPSPAFNILLSAVVETRGSQVGMGLWEKWCIDIERSHAARLAVDEKYRLQMSADPANTENLDIEYDWPWHYERQRKAVNPNLNTLRIISRAAVMELKQSQEVAPDRKNMTPSQQQFRDQVYHVLDFCVDRYQRFNRDKDEIGRETGGHLRRIRMWQSRKRRNIVRWVYGDLGEDDTGGVEELLAKTGNEEKDGVY